MALWSYIDWILILFFIGGISNLDTDLNPAVISDAVGNRANEKSEITWAPIPPGLTYRNPVYSNEHLKPMYNLVGHFIHILSPGPNKEMFEIITQLLKGNTNYILAKKMQVLHNIAGVIICLVIGLLFIIFMPLVGVIFFSCRFSGKCGGIPNIESMKKQNTNMWCMLTALALVFSTIFLAAGATMVYVTSWELSKTLVANSQPFKINLRNMEIYLKNMAQEIEYVQSNNFNFTSNVLRRDLDNIGHLIGVPVREQLGTEGHIYDVFASLESLDENAKTISVDLKAVNQHRENTIEAFSVFQNDMERVKSDLDDVLAQPTCIGCSGIIDSSKLVPHFDASKLPNMDDQLAKAENINNREIWDTVQESKNDFENIPRRVMKETTKEIHDIEAQLAQHSRSLELGLKEMRVYFRKVKDRFISVIEGYLETAEHIIQPIDNYRTTLSGACASFAYIIVLMQTLGLILGGCSNSWSAEPSKRSGLSNAGGYCLMASMIIISFISWVFMIMATLLFFIGAPARIYLCDPLTDSELTLIKKTLDTPGQVFGDYILGRKIHGNGTIPLTASGILLDCQDNTAVYEALQMHHKHDIDEITDYESHLQMGQILNRMDIDLSSMKIVTDDMSQKLDDLKNALDVDFGGFNDELNKDISHVHLREFAKDLRGLAANVSDPTKTDLNNIAEELDTVYDTSYADLGTNKTQLDKAVSDLENDITPLKASINSVHSNAQAADEYLQNKATDMAMNEAKLYIKRILGILHSYTFFVITAITEEIGRCLPIWNIWDSMVDDIICTGVVANMNCVWFSLGWCVFSMLFCAIADVRLAKYLKTLTNNQDGKSVSELDENVPGDMPRLNAVVSPSAIAPKSGARNMKVQPLAAFLD